ncbi:MAG TPA: ATP-binding protein [Candidatus Tectomicrobia bacterium]|nr:ATP-binding protein [Candidatus Tectomicrobia bacterium]
MITELERRLAEFVDREQEMRRFCDMLDTGEKPILVVWGDGGVGKSSLLARMIHECAQRKLRKVEVTWTETRNHDYLAIMRKIRDDIGTDLFKPFTDLVNFFTVPHYELQVKVENAAAIAVAHEAQIEASSIGSIAGIMVKDSMFVVPRSDMAVPEAERMARLTDRFMENFAAALESGTKVVVFFDAVEKMTDDTRKWVWNELLRGVRERRLCNVRFILCGREEPLLDRDMQMIVEEAELRPLALADIAAYLAKRGVEANSCSALAAMLMVATKGNPLQIATLVDGFLSLQKKKTHPDG